jgi:hypothetical protein
MQQVLQLHLKHSVIRHEDIQALDNSFQLIPRVENAVTLLNIEALVELTDIDPAFLGLLFLIRQKCKGLTIHIKLPHNREFTIRPEPIFKLKQYAIYGLIFLGFQPFKLDSADGPVEFGTGRFKKYDFVVSGRFSVPLIIDKENSDQYNILFMKAAPEFVESIKPGAESDIEWKANLEDLYQDLNDLYRNRSNLSDKKGCILNLGKIAFFRSLRETWSLTAYLDPERKKNPESLSLNCRAGNLRATGPKGEMNALEYFKLVEPIFLELASRPLIYSFVFNMLLSLEMLPAALDKDNAKEFAQVLKKRWSFCRDLVHGLIELAKNIKEHSSTGFGIITSRIATKKATTAEGEYPWYTEFQSQLPVQKNQESAGSILEIQVMDLGEKGIVPKLLENLETAVKDKPLPELIKKVYQEDIDRIKVGAVKLSALLAPNTESPLNHQSKRAVAHLGLLIFSKLIEHNNGQLLASSKNFESMREIAVIPQNRNFRYPHLEEGTLFRFLLPVREGAIYDTQIPHASDFPADITPEQVIGLESLLEFSVINLNNTFEEKELTNQKIVFTYAPKPQILNTHPDEYNWWIQIRKELRKIESSIKDSANKIIHLDLKKINLDHSQLFRLLGLWEIHYPKNPLLLSNVQQEIIEKLVEVNEYYHMQNPSLPFWNKHAPVIIYSYVEDLSKVGTRFYFADALWGETPDDFYLMNRVINTYHFNSVIWLRRLKEQDDRHVKIGDAEMTGHPAFFYRKHYLLPFDLLLVQENGQNLFEINTSFLLQNDIQPSCL